MSYEVAVAPPWEMEVPARNVAGLPTSGWIGAVGTAFAVEIIALCTYFVYASNKPLKVLGTATVALSSWRGFLRLVHVLVRVLVLVLVLVLNPALRISSLDELLAQ